MDMPKKVEVEPVKPVPPPIKVEPGKVEPVKAETKDESKPQAAPPVAAKH